MQMDVRDMSYFADDSFDTVIDKGESFVPLLCFCFVLILVEKAY